MSERLPRRQMERARNMLDAKLASYDLNAVTVVADLLAEKDELVERLSSGTGVSDSVDRPLVPGEKAKKRMIKHEQLANRASKRV